MNIKKVLSEGFIILLPLSLLLIGFGIFQVIQEYPQWFPDWRRVDLKVNAMISYIGGFLVLVILGLVIAWQTANWWSRIAALSVLGLVLATVGVGFFVRWMVYPDEVCTDFEMVTSSSESDYRVLEVADYRGYRYTLYFDAKGYAGDAPQPFVALSYSPIKQPRVEKCFHKGRLVEHFLDQGVEISGGRMSFEDKKVYLTTQNGEKAIDFDSEVPSDPS